MDWHFSVSVRLSAPPTDDQIDALTTWAGNHSGVAFFNPSGLGVAIVVQAGDVDAALDKGSRAAVGAIRRIVGKKSMIRVDEKTAQEWEAFEAEIERPNFPELVGVTETAELLGVTKQRVSTLARSAHFPGPIFELAAGPIWSKLAIERFVERWNRKPGRPKTTDRHSETG